MPILVNHYAPQRNPERVLKLCGVDVPRSMAAERVFLDSLFQMDSARLRNLLLVVGGFTDGVQGMARALVDSLPDDVRALCDVYYREHDEGGGMRELVEFYGARGKRLFLVGHSWGGSGLTLDVVAQCRVSVDLLVTLDPVDWRKRPTPLRHVRHWLNIYVDYNHAPVTVSNTVARIGRPWGRLDAADENQVFVGAAHQAAESMFRLHSLEPLRKALARV